MTFNNLATTEATMLKRIRTRNNVSLRSRAEVAYKEQDNFTICLLKTPKDIFCGVAKYNPSDNGRNGIGKEISFNRAARDMLRL